MGNLEFAALNTQTGYGYKMLQLERNGTKDNSSRSGAALSGEISLGFVGKASEDGVEGKLGLDLITTRVDALIGQASDNYLRYVLELGPYIHADAKGEASFRSGYGYGVRARLESVNVGDNGETISGHTWNVEFPLAFGLGGGPIFIEDQLKLMIELNSPSFKMENEVTANYRPYVNYNNAFFQSIDIFFSCVSQMGKITTDIRENSTALIGGLRLGFLNYSIKTN